MTFRWLNDLKCDARVPRNLMIHRDITLPGFGSLKVATLCCTSTGLLSNSFCMRTPSPAGSFAVFRAPTVGAGDSVTASTISCTVSATLSSMGAKMGASVMISSALRASCFFGPKFLGLIVGAMMGAPSLSTPRKPSIPVRLAIPSCHYDTMSAFLAGHVSPCSAGYYSTVTLMDRNPGHEVCA